MDLIINFLAISFIFFLVIGVFSVYYILACELYYVLKNKIIQKRVIKEYEDWKYRNGILDSDFSLEEKWKKKI